MATATRSTWRPRGIAISDRRRRLFAALLLAAAALLAVLPGARAAARSEDGKKDANEFVSLPAILVPIIVGRRVVGQAGVRVQLHLADPADFNEVEAQRARLTDAFLSTLYGLVDQLENAPHAIEPALVKARFARVAAAILGPGKIREIVILGSYEKRSDRPPGS